MEFSQIRFPKDIKPGEVSNLAAAILKEKED